MKISKLVLLLSIAMIMASCSPQVLNEPPLQYSFMPKFLDIDSIQPILEGDTNDVLDPSYHDFVSIPVDSGMLHTVYGDSMEIPEGVLISDRKAVLYLYYKSGWERYKTESKYSQYLMKAYYDKSKAAEILYQDEIVRLQKKARRTWLEKNMGYLGFMAGLATAILTEIFVIKVVD